MQRKLIIIAATLTLVLAGVAGTAKQADPAHASGGLHVPAGWNRVHNIR